MQHRTPLQILASITNGQKSTGPKTEDGKAASSLNAINHGLSAVFMVMPWEIKEEYLDLYAGFEAEFPPANAVEQELLESMVQARWLVKRSLVLQQLCFQQDYPGCEDSKLALYLRYQGTHERAFHKAHAELQKIKAGREKSERQTVREETVQELGFVLQRREEASEIRRQQSHEAAQRAKNISIRMQELRLMQLESRLAAKNLAIPVAA